MEINKQEALDKFSQLLIQSKQYDLFKPSGSVANPTSKGHGPFCLLDDGAQVYDLRSNSSRWTFGHTHPLELKCQTSFEKSKKGHSKAEAITCKSNNILAESNYKFHYFAIDLENALKALIKRDNSNQIKIFNVNYENFSLDLIETINSTTGEYILIESNIVNFHQSGSAIYNYLSKKPSYYITNFGLPHYILYSNNSNLELESNYNEYEFALSSNFLNLLRYSTIFGSKGNISKKNSTLNKVFIDFKSLLKIHGTQVQFNEAIASYEELLQLGLLCDPTKKVTHFNFPITMKETQLLECVNIIKRFL